MLPNTLLDSFLEFSTSSVSASWPVVECGEDLLAYGELLRIASGISEELTRKYGSTRPTVAVVSENHPYVLAIILATWLLGGVVAPLDRHAPEHLMRGMLKIVQPHCVVIPTSDVTNSRLSRDMGIPIYYFEAADSTIPRLIRRFSQASTHTRETSPVSPGADALYIFTSSASSITSLKCVPLTHSSINANCLGQMSWLHNSFPHTSFDRLRVLGWSPWTHIMGISHDIGTHCFLTGGCYVFGLVPSTYPNADSPVNFDDGVTDIAYLLLDTALRRGTTAFAGVPWIIAKFMEIEQSAKARKKDEESVHITQALQNFKIMISGGAKTEGKVRQWAEALRLNLVLGIGMTEFGGPLFHTKASPSAKQGWSLSERLISDAKFTIIDDAGVESKEGELYVHSRFISHGYRRFDTNTFSTTSSGITTFRTGDIYAISTDDNTIIWQGRREDYIQLLSGEILDPRVPESQLDADCNIARACLVGDSWDGASECICAILEPVEASLAPGVLIHALAGVNRTLAPPLRVAWSRVVVLEPGEKIPITRKGVIWRKALKQKFGQRLSALLEDSRLSQLNEITSSKWRMTDVESAVTEIVSEVLGMSRTLIEQHAQATFAELGMDSRMAMRIVNTLNRHFGLQMPLNTCHNYVDLSQLSKAVAQTLGLVDLPRAHVTLSVPPNLTSDADDVVVIGQAIRLPGSIATLDAFWDALTSRRTDLLGPVPADRWDHASFLDTSLPPRPGTISFPNAGFIDVARYDAAFFGISAAEAYFIAPAARLALETCVEALENANVPLSAVRGSNMAVVVATPPDDGYGQLVFQDREYEGYSRYYGSGVAASTVCGRLSYFLDVHGPSISLDTACSAGMVALDTAVQHIKRGDGETALVCSVNTHIWPGTFCFLSANQMASPRGRCATFSADADGYAPSEGVVSLVLKNKSAALRDNDNILGVIRATAVQHNGRSQGLVAPNAKSQANLQRALLVKAKLAPQDIAFVETHGTGTILGDLLEIQAINNVFSGSHSTDEPLVLGASKTVVGHTEASAGLVGVLASLMSLRTGLIPGLAHLRDDNINPNIDTALCPLVIPHSNTLLSPRQGAAPLRGLNLAYGFAGTISGVVLEEYIRMPSMDAAGPTELLGPQPLLFVLSAKTPSALGEYIQRYIDFCFRSRAEDLADICYTSCVGREHYMYRVACVVRTMPELITRLKSLLSDSSIFQPTNPRPNLIFGFPGQGSQYQGMARGLCLHDVTFNALLRRGAREASDILQIDLLPFLLETEDNGTRSSEGINQTHVAQACIYVFQCAMSEWLQTVGIHPCGVLPHSFGEIAASVTAGAISFRTGLEFTITRSISMRPDALRPGAMIAINASHEFIADTIQASNLQDHVCIAAFNSSYHNVASGDEWAIDNLVSILGPKVRCTKLAVNQAFHSHCIEKAISPIRRWLDARKPALGSPSLPFYSSARGSRIRDGEQLDSEYWIEQARQPIRFAAAANEAARDRVTMILDIGPQPLLSNLLSDIPGCDSISMASLTPKKSKNPDSALMAALAALFIHGVTPDFARFYAGRLKVPRKIALPTYPWQKQHHYPKAIPSRYASTDKQQTSLTASWDIDSDFLTLLTDHSSDSSPVLPTAAMIILLVQSVQGDDPSITADMDVRILKPMVLDTAGENKVTVEIIEPSLEYSVMHHVSSLTDTVCTGSVRRLQRVLEGRGAMALPESNPESVLTKSEVYARLEHGRVAFGSKFQNLAEVRIWADHADGIVQVEPTGDLRSDLIRQLDPCLHMFGVIAPRTLPGYAGAGSFLPTAIHSLKIFFKSLPHAFTCRYVLPIKVERNFRKMTTSFEILSQSGDILASCQAYSVAWIPANLPFVREADQGSSELGPSLLRTVWSHMPRTRASPAKRTSYRLVYIGTNRSLQNALTIRAVTQGHSFIASDRIPWPGNSDFSDIILYDAMLPDDAVCLDRVTAYSNDALDFMKSTSRALRSQNIASIVVLTRNAVVVLPEDTDENLSLAPQQYAGNALALAGSMVQGMLRVLRHECDTHIVWGCDVPSLSSLELADLLLEEIDFPARILRSPIVYRHSSEGNLLRLVASLRREAGANNSQPGTGLSGTVLIIGLGDIGKAMVDRFVQEGCSGVVFIGRRQEFDPEILSALDQLRSNHPKTPFTYYSADVTSFTSLRGALMTAVSQKNLGPIQTVVHTASIVKDSVIANTTRTSFQDVIKPKVWGSWNLHLACIDLKLDVRRFVVLSSISVPLGNPGQIAYVAANSFLDALASYRSLLLPTTRSVSLQLGAWESRLIKGMHFDGGPIGPISNTEGLPLMFEAIGGKRTVQILAKLYPKRMQQSMYAEDAYFKEFLELEVGAKKCSTKSVTREGVEDALSTLIRDLLEIPPEEQLNFSASLVSFGMDSISFTQLRGALMTMFGVNIPMTFLAEDNVAMDVIDHIML